MKNIINYDCAIFMPEIQNYKLYNSAAILT